MKFSLLASAALLAISPCSYAQLYTYDNQSEVAGAAIMTLHAKGEIVQSTMSYCAKSGAFKQEVAKNVVDSWRDRNETYLSLAPILLEEMHRHYVRAKKDHEWVLFLKSTLPQQVDLLAAALVKQIEILPEEKQRHAMCANLVSAIDSGRLDFSQEESEIRDYLDRRLKKRGGSE